MATSSSISEPDEEWKKSLRSSIQARLSLQVEMARQERHRKLIRLSRQHGHGHHSSHTASSSLFSAVTTNPHDRDDDKEKEREREKRKKEIEEEYEKSMKSIKMVSESMFKQELEKERARRRKLNSTRTDDAPPSRNSAHSASISEKTIKDQSPHAIVNDRSSEEGGSSADDLLAILSSKNSVTSSSRPSSTPKQSTYTPSYPPLPPADQDSPAPLPGSYPPEPKYPPPPPTEAPLRIRPTQATPQPTTSDNRTPSQDSEEYDFGSLIDAGDSASDLVGAADDMVGRAKDEEEEEELFCGGEWEDVTFDINGTLDRKGDEKSPVATRSPKSAARKVENTGNSATAVDALREGTSALEKREDELKKKEEELRKREEGLLSREQSLRNKEEQLDLKEGGFKIREEEIRAKEKQIEEREARRNKAREELFRRREQEASSRRRTEEDRWGLPDPPTSSRIPVAESPSRKTADAPVDSFAYDISRRREPTPRSSETGAGSLDRSYPSQQRPYSTASDFARWGQTTGRSADRTSGNSSSLADDSPNWNRWAVWQNS